MNAGDRELLELAAKAAGLINPMPALGCGIVHGGGMYWNPLTSDGDALRLAVKLHLTVEQWEEGHVYCGRPGASYADERHGKDPYAATRRAIVRAAAGIGRAMS